MEEKIRNLYDFLNSKHIYYIDFMKYEESIGNEKNANTLDARANELYFVMNELLRVLNKTEYVNESEHRPS